MVHAYHMIMPCYGFWLPNDPRGSWSESVRKFDLIKYGQSTKSNERRQTNQLSDAEIRLSQNAKSSLKYRAVSFSERQIELVAEGFGVKAKLSRYTIWACAILPEHAHIVIARHHYESEKIANQLKGAATRSLIFNRHHLLAEFATGKERKRYPRMWAEHEWIVYLDSEELILDAIEYVEKNPTKEGRDRQSWEFVESFEGLDRSAWRTYSR